MSPQSIALRNDASRVVLGCELAAEIVREFGEVRVRAFGASMVPAILPGDAISIRRAGLREISLGDIAVFFRDGRIFAHRVVGRAQCGGDACLLARGDRLRYSDAPVRAQELVGRVQWIHRGELRLRPDARLPLRQRMILPLMRISNWATYAYVRLARSVNAARAECRI